MNETAFHLMCVIFHHACKSKPTSFDHFQCYAKRKNQTQSKAIWRSEMCVIYGYLSPNNDWTHCGPDQSSKCMISQKTWPFTSSPSGTSCRYWFLGHRSYLKERRQKTKQQIDKFTVKLISSSPVFGLRPPDKAWASHHPSVTDTQLLHCRAEWVCSSLCPEPG